MNRRVASALSACLVAVIASAANAEAQTAGQYEYRSSCASCHGLAGRGDGPLANALKRTPADLTKLTENNNGVFPFARVYNVIDGRIAIMAHGPRDMPVWGEIFKSPRISGDPPLPPQSPEQAEYVVRERIVELIQYLASLQGK